jgi:hypothetical protein
MVESAQHQHIDNTTVGASRREALSFPSRCIGSGVYVGASFLILQDHNAIQFCEIKRHSSNARLSLNTTHGGNLRSFADDQDDGSNDGNFEDVVQGNEPCTTLVIPTYIERTIAPICHKSFLWSGSL